MKPFNLNLIFKFQKSSLSPEDFIIHFGTYCVTMYMPAEYVLTLARRPLEIASGYLNFQLAAQIGYWKSNYIFL